MAEGIIDEGTIVGVVLGKNVGAAVMKTSHP